MRHALISTESKIVENIVELDEESDWSPPEGFISVASDSANIGDSYDEVTGTFTAPEPPASPPPTERVFVLAIQAMMDETAQSRNYDNILAACSYAASTHPKFGPEGRACLAWRDQIWSQCYADLAAVQGGQKQIPEIAEYLASLPAIDWPA